MKATPDHNETWPRANLVASVVEGFGDEWTRFDQSGVSPEELSTIFFGYFSIFPWEDLPSHAEGFDMGCGSGRWAAFVAPRVGRLHLIDASEDALAVARCKLVNFTNVTFAHASVAEPPLADGSQDFGYSLGVLHHIPDTLAGLRACVEKLKPGAPFLLIFTTASTTARLGFAWSGRRATSCGGSFRGAAWSALHRFADNRSACLLAVGAVRAESRKFRRFAGRPAAVLLSRQILLHDAN